MHTITHITCFFFFSSRRRHTRCSRDWSSDVCSSDLVEGCSLVHVFHPVAQHAVDQAGQLGGHGLDRDGRPQPGSESTELCSQIGFALVLLCRKVLAAIFKAILIGLLVGSRPLPMTLFPLMRLSGHSRSQETK